MTDRGNIRITFDEVNDIFRSEENAVSRRWRARPGRSRGSISEGPWDSTRLCTYPTSPNKCAYCGFQASRHVERKKLTPDEMEKECAALAATGIRSCLLLTGESRFHSPPSYIREAITIAGKYFANIGIEVYALETGEYRELYLAGADGVTLFQETYDRGRYDELHLAGPKKNYDYRVNAPERIAQAGFRQISMGVLLGLADWRRDVVCLSSTSRHTWKKIPRG